MGEILKPFTQWTAGQIGMGVAGVIFVLSLFFEFSKIKLSPFTALFKWIGDRITAGLRADIADLKKTTDDKFAEMKKDTDERMNRLEDAVAQIREKNIQSDDKFQKQLAEIEERQDLQMASRIKAHVLNFSRQCRNGEKHSIEDFKNLFQENLEYSQLVAKHGWVNDVYKHDFAFIERVYDECNANNDFLGG